MHPAAVRGVDAGPERRHPPPRGARADRGNGCDGSGGVGGNVDALRRRGRAPLAQPDRRAAPRRADRRRAAGDGRGRAGRQSRVTERRAWLPAAAVLAVVYAATLAPDVTFWDAGEFIAAAHSLGIPHPPGTPLFVLLLNAWTKLIPIPLALATNALSAIATALAAGLTARLVQRATGQGAMALAAAVAAGGMSSVWLNATETEVYAPSLLLGVLMMWAGERAGRAGQTGQTRRRWVFLTAYLIILSVPLHLSALVAAPAAIVLAAFPSGDAIDWRRAGLLAGAFAVAMGVGRM